MFIQNLIVTLFLLFSFQTAQSAEVPTVSFVDLNQYIGKWHEVASIPQWFQRKCVSDTTAEYTLLESGHVSVINSCQVKSGQRDTAEGRAKVVDTVTNAKLKVTFVKIIDWIFTFGGNYWILDLAPDYSYALVGDPTLEYAWILARTPNVGKSVYVNAELKFKSLGYDTCKILTSVQSQGLSTRQPLCEYVK